MTAQQSSSELVKIGASYPALVGAGGAMSEAMKTNMEGETLSVFDLERVRVPSGGGIAWEVLDEAGEPQPVKALDGIVVFTKLGRSYWAKGIDESGGGSPPDCSSPDAVRGVGKPGGLCHDCELAQWGSAGDGGRGQACSQRRFVFVLREGATLPTVISVPPTSLKPLKKWLFALANRGVPYFGAVTRFSLEKTKNAAGIEYAQVKPSTVRTLAPEEVELVKAFALQTRETFREYSEGAEEAASDKVGGTDADD